jgi:hypothetical protein
MWCTRSRRWTTRERHLRPTERVQLRAKRAPGASQLNRSVARLRLFMSRTRNPGSPTAASKAPKATHGCGGEAAERWFLVRGLPAVLTARARWRHLWPRSAPALAAYATVVVALLVVYFLMGTSEIYIDGPPTPAERIVLAVIALAVPVAALVVSHATGPGRPATRATARRRWPGGRGCGGRARATRNAARFARRTCRRCRAGREPAPIVRRAERAT